MDICVLSNNVQSRNGVLPTNVVKQVLWLSIYVVLVNKLLTSNTNISSAMLSSVIKDMYWVGRSKVLSSSHKRCSCSFLPI